RGIDCLIGVGESISDNQELIDIAEKHFFMTTNDFLNSQLIHSLANDIILIKGARRYHFDRITDALELKVHETILEVNLNAIVDNLNFYRSHMSAETKVVAMVKADAYGAGAVEVAKILQDQQIDYLAVAVADEGAQLRKAGIKSNIMVMNPEMTAFKTIFDYNLEPEVYNFRLLDALIKAAKQYGVTDYPVHIKLDTGMHRLGFNPETEVEQLVEILKAQKAVTPRSVFSHFVGADEDQFDDFSAEQFHKFEHGSAILQAAFKHKILRHIDNSAGILHFHERQLDMCRLGIGLYGVNNRDNSIINNVSTLKTTILQIRNVKKEDTVGYSKRGVLQRDSRIAAIPIGYADGLNRHLGRGNCYCLVNGKKAYYVGNICMDVAMIDVTDIDCQEGDSVEVYGKNLPVTVLSDALDTIPYEVLTSISSRVKKVYIHE
ncbi:MAG: alanine racemase, partial [Bacteroidaceae bacterium]|nr:alanine racemase [Bacteroidaceae bacterium]